jgi:hypothetical protein
MMTDEQQRITIAEACGWKDNTDYGRGMYWISPTGQESFHGPDVLPDYLNDLNAMHEAEKALTHEQLTHYRLTQLPRVCDKTQPMNGCVQEAVSATAAQRAEAFLRTLGLWKD